MGRSSPGTARSSGTSAQPVQERLPGKAPCAANPASRNLSGLRQCGKVVFGYAQQLSSLGEVKHCIVQLTADNPGSGCRAWMPGDVLALEVEVVADQGCQHVSFGQAQPRGRTVQL